MFTKYCAGYQIGDQPHFDAEGGVFFAEHIRSTKVYLEYGGGGSTILASQFVDCLVSADSDKYFVKAIRKKLGKANRPQLVIDLLHCDIGITGVWGIPVFPLLSEGRLHLWEAYAKRPWDLLAERGIQPDTILIDGRFRVACALVSLLNISDRENTTLILDDYTERDCYKTVEDFADLIAIKGRMAIFKKSATFDKERCERLCDVYFRDWR